MHIHKPQKIDLEQIYPCPCPRKRGKLKPIALTDAFGCDRCSLLFELENDGYSLLQVGGIDSQRHKWQWIGKWRAIREYQQYPLLETVLMYITSLLFLSLVIMWILDPKSAFTIPLVILLFTLLSLLVWRLLILRRRSF
ncbi:MAG: hypothetical protein ACK47D_00155 [Pseudanabaena sp.]|nr:hypothetical protein [Microcystis sp. M42BS1]MCA6574111.1 hypothetical protein [Pseudanabaena sp. M53BS1SP1A06MG]MCA6583521.1 hypothetical protein [Pseudanabaena sp. M34BS1SP1A06MG]MCA6585341.1 hypothetical protein [Pseudanabaena sp. M051S1SP1A06QC]MCA6591457.1 hypothetical protein [Pseudanabaena sp. M38BS1SP1A06MG]MCA6595017.1 hypothetical protein [Pseudanabaena sp. M046S1SP1A06QC]MCA6599264.1 hypothetical protein [Pseudanabaena sp. M57BS1SP1A06MG]MCA6613934.1 hypothetical protein [Pseud